MRRYLTATGQRRADRTVSAIGTARRLQALAVLGYSTVEIGHAIGLHRDEVARIRNGRRDRVYKTTARAVRDLAHALHSRVRPIDEPGRSSGRARARSWALRQGWVTAAAWDDIDDPHERPDRSYLRDGIVRNDDGNGCKILDEHQIDAIRAAYRAAAPGTWETLAVAEQYGVRDGAVREALRGTLVAGYTDVVAELGVKWGHPGGPAASITDDVIHAVRADYLAGTPWSQIGPRHGVSKTLAARIVHGRIRPHLGLEDLTAHKRGDNTAATPTSRETGKESAA